MTQDKIDILVIGSGMAGLSLAALLGKQGFNVTVVDREKPEVMATEAFDARTIALSIGSRDILAPLRLWDTLLPHGAPITKIDVQEGHDPYLLNFDANTTEDGAFGWIFPNTVVRGNLYQSALAHGVKFVTPAVLKNIEQNDDSVTAILQDGTRLTANVLIGADGRQSRVRDLIGVPTIQLPYHHIAWVGLVHHEHPHDGLAVERFYTDGPFAILPFVDDASGKHRSAIVWSQHDKTGRVKRVLPSLEQITEGLKPMFDERYGDIQAIGKWAAYPLSLTHAKSYVAGNVALISDAAHAIHPIAGQGLNLGMRDVKVLVEELAMTQTSEKDIQQALEAYQSRRRFDVFAMIAATDILTRLFGNRLKTVAKLRSLGLGLVNHVPPLKRFFANAAMGK